ncbi:MAG: hypothetical protein DCE90_13225 [Pseudanabaena sp.]|nr:MAG: hypothetical protein DCE90_13225 [Pseudanabaena sp.]
MRLHKNTPLSSFALGLVSLFGTSLCTLNLGDLAIAQSFPTSSTASTTQYLVYLPNASSLQRARAIAPDAFTSRLDTGEQIVQLGRFNNLNLAQKRVDQFSKAGLQAQIINVQGKFSSFPSQPVSSIPPIPNSFPPSSLPTPVESIPIPNSRVVDPLPGVPGNDFPTNSIEIVRSPQPLPPQAQPIPPNPTVAVQAPPSSVQLRYFVIIPTGLVSELQRVQAIAPNAQLRSSFRGTYIEVQGYPDRPSAETLNLTIRRQGFDSRVVFF